MSEWFKSRDRMKSNEFFQIRLVKIPTFVFYYNNVRGLVVLDGFLKKSMNFIFNRFSRQIGITIILYRKNRLNRYLWL